MTEPHRDIEPDAGEAAKRAGDVEFPCDNCGAEMTWDPVADVMLCDYCDAMLAVPRAEGTILERPLEEAGEAARGYGVERLVARCDNCGAGVMLDDAATAEACVYCGSATVLEQSANRNAIRPESLIPLDLGRELVEQSFRRWVGRLWFRPNALKKPRRLDVRGIYVPFWSFDCAAHSDWSADAGHYYWVTRHYWTTVNGKRVRRSRRVRKIRWVPAWGNRDDRYDDMLVNASAGLPQHLVARLGTFDTSQLVPYRPEYLAGWRAEEYRVDLESGWRAGQGVVESTQRTRCAGDIPGDTHRNLRVRNALSEIRWKHVLLPIWSVQYRLEERTYTVLVHGQSGRIVGDAPYSWVKIAGLVLGIIGAVLVALVVLGLVGM